MPKPITDPALLEELNKPSVSEPRAVADPFILEQLNAPPRPAEERYRDLGGDLKQDEKRTFIHGAIPYGEEIMGMMSAVPDALRGDAKFWDAYANHVNDQRAGVQRYKDFDPNGAWNTEMAGIATSMVGPGAIFKGARAAGLGLKGALGVAGVTGGINYGSGNADPDPTSSWPEAAAKRQKGANVGALMGGILGPAAGALGEKLVGPIASAVGKAYGAVAKPQNGAYEAFLNLIGGPQKLEEFATHLATGSGAKTEQVQRRTFDILGEEMAKAGGDAKAATQATIQRIQSEFGVVERTAKENLTNLRGANRDSDLMIAEYPAVAKANADTRLKRTTATPEEIGRIEDHPAQSVYDDLANSGGTNSVATTTNALMNRANNAGADMTERIQGFAPKTEKVQGGPPVRPQTIDDVEEMITGLKDDAGTIYNKIYDPDPHNKLVDNAILQTELRGVVDRAIDKWAGRGGDYKAALDDAIKEFYFKTPDNQTILMPTLKMTQDMRGALRGKMEKAPSHIRNVLQPMYKEVTDAMTKASPEWAKANAKYAEGSIAEKVTELADAFSLKAGPKYREQLWEFKELEPKFQDVVKVHFLRKIEDLLDNTKNSHDISKFFDNRHIQRSIGDIFGEESAKEWSRIIRDAKVATKSKNMLGNSKTASRLARQEAGTSDEKIVAAVKNASDPRNWISKKISQLLTERKNKALADIVTTPVSDVAKTAEHVQGMRQVPERAKKFDALPRKYGERMGRPAGFIGSRTQGEEEMPDRGQRYNWKPQTRAEGGEAYQSLPDMGRDAPTIPPYKDLSNQDLYDQFPGFFPSKPEKDQQQEFIRKRMQEGVPGTDALYEWYKMQEQNKRPGFDDGGGVLDSEAYEEEPSLDLEGYFGNSIDAFSRIPSDIQEMGWSGVAKGGLDAAGAVAGSVPSGIGKGIARAGEIATDLLTRSPAASKIGLGTAAFATPTMAGDAESPLLALREQQARLQRERAEAVSRRDPFTPKGRAPNADRDPNYTGYDTKVRELDAKLSALDSQIAEENRKNSPEFAREMDLKLKGDAEKERVRRSNMSTRELWSDYMPYVPLATGIAGFGLGAMLKGRSIGNLNSTLAEIESRWQTAVQAGKAAAAKGDTGKAQQLLVESDELARAMDSAKKGSWGESLAPAQAGATTGLVGGFLPEEVDFARAIPGGELQESVLKPYKDDPWLLPKRALVSAGLGAAPAEIAAYGVGALRGKPAPVGFKPETEGLRSALSRAPQESLGSPPRIPERGALPAPQPGPANLGQAPSTSALPKPAAPQTLGSPPSTPAARSSSASPAANTNTPSKKAKTKELPYYKIKTRDGRELHRARGTERWHPNPQKAKPSKPAAINRVSKAVQTPKEPKVTQEIPSTPAGPDLGKTFSDQRSAIMGGNVDGVVAKIADDTGMEPSAVRRELMRWLDEQG